MTVLGLACVVVAPAMFWAAYHFYHDRHQPEPYHLLALSFALGIGSGALGTHAYAALDLLNLRWDAFDLAHTNRWGFAVYAIAVIGVIEESVKLVPFVFVVMRFGHFDEPIDGIVYASFIALGFAAYENVHYLTLLPTHEALLRGIASPLVHALFASIWGYLGARAVVQGKRVWPALLLGLGIASLTHGLYDFFTIGTGPWLRLVSALLILITWIWRRRLIEMLSRRHRR